MDKKENMRYWDKIDDIATECVNRICQMSTVKVELEVNDETVLYKEVVELVTNYLKTLGCEFPYVDENY